jgi:predicted outer membrane lipoprotein
MKKLGTFVGLAAIMVLSLFLAIITGDYGPWYFAWLVGTTMLVLIAAAGAIMFDKQEEEQQGKKGSTR